MQLRSYIVLLIQKETRRIYNMLKEEDPENFEEWKIEPGYV